MNTTDEFHDPFPQQIRDICLTVGGVAMLLMAYGLVGNIDYAEDMRLEAVREERAASLAAGLCLPRPGQETRWVWKTAEGAPLVVSRKGPKPDPDSLRLHCAIYDAPADYGRAPNLVMTAAPAGLDRLALFQGERK